MAHEKETLEAVIQARNQAQAACRQPLKTQAMRVRLPDSPVPKVYSVELWDAFLPFPKAILISKPIKTWPTSKRN